MDVSGLVITGASAAFGGTWGQLTSRVIASASPLSGTIIGAVSFAVLALSEQCLEQETRSKQVAYSIASFVLGSGISMIFLRVIHLPVTFQACLLFNVQSIAILGGVVGSCVLAKKVAEMVMGGFLFSWSGI